MLMKLIRYRLHPNGLGGMITPTFIQDGGYFPDVGASEDMIGLVDNDRKYYMPNTNKDTPAGELVEYTRAELITYCQTDIPTQFTKIDGTPLTNDEIGVYITAWCDEKNVEV